MAGNSFPITNLLQNARDGVTFAMTVVDYVHHEVHEGSAYYTEGHVTLSDTEQLTVKYSVPPGPKQIHFEWLIQGTGEMDLGLWEDAVGGMTGGLITTPINNNRNSTKAATMVVTSGVTTSTAVGTRVHTWLSGQAGTKFVSATPSAAHRADELVLKEGSTYIGRIISNSTGNNISFRAYWYEHTPKTGLKVAD